MADHSDERPTIAAADPAESPPQVGVDRQQSGAATAHGVSRRGFLLGTAGAAAAGAVAGAGGMYLSARDEADVAALSDTTIELADRVPFYDQPHPPGVQTPVQRHALYMTFDVLPTATRRDLQVLLARWSAAIAQMTEGEPIGPVRPDGVNAIGTDTGEALGLEPSSLTVTVGLGPGLFDDRFGLADRRPAKLADLPRLPGDDLDPAYTGGDLSIQACANDAQVAYHAVRNLARMARTTVQTRWTVEGFGRASAGQGQQTPRNLFGFKDGTRNVGADNEFDDFVWLHGGDDADWMTGGTYQVVRKIRMNIEIWDADVLSDQERIFGHHKVSGAPLTGNAEFDTPDFHARDADGKYVIDVASHIRLAAHENNDGVKILRRAYNYTDGLNNVGQLDAGLLFVVYANDPDHFVGIQRRLGASDALNEYITHIGSAIFAVPPTPATGHYIGDSLFL